MNEILSNPYFLVLIFIVISAIAIPTTSPDKAVKLAANPSELTIVDIYKQRNPYTIGIDIGMPDDDVLYCHSSDTYRNHQKGNFYYQDKKADAQQKAELIKAVNLYFEAMPKKKKEFTELFKDMKP